MCSSCAERGGRRHASPLRSRGRKSISGREKPTEPPTGAAPSAPHRRGQGRVPPCPQAPPAGTRRAQPLHSRGEVTAASGLKFGGERQTPSRLTPTRLVAYLWRGARCPQPSRRTEQRSCAVPVRHGASPVRRRLAQGVTGRRLPSPFPGTVLGERRAGAGMASRQERGRGGHCRPEEDARRPGAARPPAASAGPAGGGLPLLAPRRRAGAIAALRGSRRGGTAAKQPPRGAWAGGGSAEQNFPGSSAGCPGGARPRRRCGGGGRGRTPLSQPARPLLSAPPGLGPHGPPAAKFRSGPISMETNPWFPSAPHGTRRRRVARSPVAAMGGSRDQPRGR